MAHTRRLIIGGVDTHTATHHAAVINLNGDCSPTRSSPPHHTATRKLADVDAQQKPPRQGRYTPIGGRYVRTRRPFNLRQAFATASDPFHK